MTLEASEGKTASNMRMTKMMTGIRSSRKGGGDSGGSMSGNSKSDTVHSSPPSMPSLRLLGREGEIEKVDNQKSSKVEPLKPLVIKELELEVDDGKKKVTIMFGTQTSTAEGFAKVLKKIFCQVSLSQNDVRTRARGDGGL
ncbi:hypothetical protein NE237_030408 [Protea cynaroides]|uniref:Uncharacterized protein n=1 Tax=Protea cynaroides TaxID=273540 RepID=A0A9Q0GV11_9MAGN|nr:hypothetical protein NE237_030408 [Protea cynaroides]